MTAKHGYECGLFNRLKLRQGENYAMERVLTEVNAIHHGQQTIWAPQTVSLRVGELHYCYPGRDGERSPHTIDFFGLRDIGANSAAAMH
eukprot:COSAG05_NODE_977_length_6332_cov_10.027755_5_plen_89_part_00